jgi:RNA 3'-terminal phosphate cyclase (ATP)
MAAPPRIEIDGSRGEGGGQVLRSSLALSLLTGTPFRITNIRAGRKKPGIMRQHLTAVTAAAEVGNAEVRGSALGSRELFFTPQSVTPGTYHFAVGTAGSCSLVLQTVLPALLTASGSSELVLEGGTHNPYAPPFDFLARSFLPLVNRMGPRVTAVLDQPGFFPAGGGRFRVAIEPARELSRVDVLERGRIKGRRGRALVAHLPRHIAEREIKVLRDKLSWDRGCFQVEEVEESRGPGNVLIVEIESEEVTEVFTGFGERGVRAEQVAARTAKAVREYLKSEAPVGPYLADQLLIPMALAGGGRFLTMAPTLHTRTNAEVVEIFLGATMAVAERGDGVWDVAIERPDSLNGANG